uniref:Uncharacterized protein n=1 Tax=Rhizophora mucronata TaxID=61149 RepID=A0A2P2QUP9_RHIMU
MPRATHITNHQKKNKKGKHEMKDRTTVHQIHTMEKGYQTKELRLQPVRRDKIEESFSIE